MSNGLSAFWADVSPPLEGASFHPKRPKSSSQPFQVTKNDQKVVFSHFGSPDTASTTGNTILCDMKRLRRPEMPFHATRNGFDGRKCHFMRHETAPTTGNVISCDMKRLRRPEMPFYATQRGSGDRRRLFKRCASRYASRPGKKRAAARAMNAKGDGSRLMLMTYEKEKSHQVGAGLSRPYESAPCPCG